MRGREIRQERFGGLNLRDEDLSDDDARDLRNVVGKPRGGVKTRDGSSVFNSAALSSTVLPAGYRFIDIWPVGYQRTTHLHTIGGGATTQDSQQAIFGIAIDASDPGSSTADLAHLVTFLGDGTVRDHGTIPLFSGAGPGLGAPGNGYLGVATGPGGIYVLGNGGFTAGGGDPAYIIGPASDTPAAWTPTAGDIPKGNVLKWWSGRMLVTAISNRPSRVEASAIGNANYWSVTADVNGQQAWTVDIEPGDADVIVGWGQVGTYLAVFKRRRSWVIYDGDTGANHILSPNLGATSRYAIAETPHGLCWQAQDFSIWTTDGSSVKRLSEKVDPLLMEEAAVGYAEDHLYVTQPSVGTLDYDFITEEWRRHSFVAQQFASQDFDDGDGQILFGITSRANAGKNVLRYFDPLEVTDAGTPFDSWWASRHNKYGSEVLKRIHELRVEGTGVVTVSFSKEQGAEEYQRIADMDSNQRQARVLTPGVARSWGFRFQNSVNPFSLDAYAVNLKARKD